MPAHLYATTRMKCEAIYANRALHSVRKMYEALKISQCQYYQWIRLRSNREKRKNREIWLVEAIKRIFTDNREVYGCRKIMNPLKQRVFSSANGRFEELCERTDSIPKLGRNGIRTERQKVMVCIAKTKSNATFCPIDLMNSGQEILPIFPPTWGGFILLPFWI